jgi:type II secretory pathway component PulF
MKREATDCVCRPGVLSYIFALCLTVWIGFFAIGFGLVAPQFSRLFAGFGAEVPTLTEFVLKTRIPIWDLLLLGFVVQLGFFVFLLVSRTFMARRSALMSSSLNIAAQLVLAAAMYIPIFWLGAVV